MRTIYVEHLLLLISWFLFAIVHHVMASPVFKARSEQLLNRYFGYYRLIYCIVAFITLGAVLFLQFSIGKILLDLPEHVTLLIAAPIGVSGGFIMILCLSKYFFRLSGISVLFGSESSAKLETTGIHKHTRHPLYLGTLLFVWSLFLFFPLLSNLVACVCITLYTIIGIRSEEQKLIVVFGEEYKKYKQQTPMLIPKFIRNR